MIEQAEKEKQYISSVETFPIESSEVRAGEGYSSAENNRPSSLKPIEVQPQVQSAQEYVSTQQITPNSIVTTGDRWNQAIKNKELGVAPTVL